MSRRRSDRPRQRQLSEEEQRLWSGITRSVAPLKRKPPAMPQARAPRDVAPAERVVAQSTRRRVAPFPPHAVKPTTKSAIKQTSAIDGLDRRRKQRLARGAEAIDARIDLHGRTQSEAHAALLGFLRRAQAEGARFVLVITGKGGFPDGSASGARGILKRQVPLWLRQTEFRHYVLAAADAHRAHGGEGALYIHIRRPRA
jgi:DNA-nicking Smr family endonuclease